MIARYVRRPFAAFRDRHEAGLALVELIRPAPDPDAVVLTLPRGGVPVGVPLAAGLGCLLSAVVARKLPMPWSPEIRWIKAFFSPDGEKFTYELGRFEFNVHDESAAGANQGPVYTGHEAGFAFRTSKPGTLHVLSICNIHGLWASERRIELA